MAIQRTVITAGARITEPGALPSASAATPDRQFLIAILGLALVGCGSDGSKHDSYQIALPMSQAKQKVLALASCPSPLFQLRIKAPLRQATEPDARTIVIAVPAEDSDAAIELRFRLDDTGSAERPATTARLSLNIPEQARELDLGEDRLLNPLTLDEDLTASLRQYFDLISSTASSVAAAEAAAAAGHSYPAGHRAADYAARTASHCRTIGRQLDAGAVMISPKLSNEIKRQHRRDAINRLFKDDYKLRTDSPEGSYW